MINVAKSTVVRECCFNSSPGVAEAKQETGSLTHHETQAFTSDIKFANCCVIQPTGPTRTETLMQHQTFNDD